MQLRPTSRSSSTTPVADSGEERASRTAGRWRTHLPVVAATLGLAATLWATLTGQTIPELIRDEKAELNAFRLEVVRVCDKHAAAFSARLDTLNRNRGLSEHQHLVRIVREWRDTADRTIASLAEIDAPDQFTEEYSAYEMSWRRLEEALGAVSVSDAGAGRLVAHVPGSARSAAERSHQAMIAMSTVMSLGRCSTVTFQIGDRILWSRVWSNSRARAG